MKKYIVWLTACALSVGGSVYLYQSLDAYPATSTTHRAIIPLGSYTYADLFALLPSGARHALFYLVDNQGNPVSGRDVVNAVGSKSIQVPLIENVSPILQNDMNTMKVQVTDENNRWIESYLDRVFAYRSQGLSGASLDAFNTSWGKVEQGYQQALKQILRCITIPESDAYAFGFQTTTKEPITLLFFDDPFPPHSRRGSARTKFKDLLGDFIKGYNLSSGSSASTLRATPTPTPQPITETPSSPVNNGSSFAQPSVSLSQSQVATLRNRLAYYRGSVEKLTTKLETLPAGSSQARQVQASINANNLQIQKLENQLSAAGY